MIDAQGLIEVIIDMVMHHCKVPKSIIIDQSLLFTSKFWSLLCYFLRINKKLFIAFHTQTND